MNRALSKTSIHPSRRLSSPKDQRGLSLLKLIFVLIVLILLAVVGMKIVPAYIEFHSVKVSMNEMKGQDFSSIAKVRRSLDEKFSINYVSTVQGRDVDIQPIAGGYDLYLDYTVKKHLVGNLALTAHFTYEVETNE